MKTGFVFEPCYFTYRNYYENLLFEIPSTWTWTTISKISNSFIGLTYKPSDVSEKGTIVLRSSNIKNGKIDFSDLVRVSCTVDEKLLVKENDILICARNGSKKLVGKSALIPFINEQVTFGAFMAICKSVFYKYVSVFLETPLFYSQLAKTSGTTTINQLTQKAFNSFYLPLPPEREQEIIYNKIKNLFEYL